MSANVFFYPRGTKRHNLSVGAPSSFLDKLDRIFGSRQPTLDEKSLPVLVALALNWDDGRSEADWNPWRQLADGVEQFGEIVVDYET